MKNGKSTLIEWLKSHMVGINCFVVQINCPYNYQHLYIMAGLTIHV